MSHPLDLDWTWYTRDVLLDEVDEDPSDATQPDALREETERQERDVDSWYRKHASAHIASLQDSNARLIERIRQLEQDLLTEQACRKIAETAIEAMKQRIADVESALVAATTNPLAVAGLTIEETIALAKRGGSNA